MDPICFSFQSLIWVKYYSCNRNLAFALVPIWILFYFLIPILILFLFGPDLDRMIEHSFSVPMWIERLFLMLISLIFFFPRPDLDFGVL